MSLFFAFNGCEEGGIELRVVATGGNFKGYYIIDGGSEKIISGTDTNGRHRFSTNLPTSFKHVEISVTKDDSTTTMDIFLYDRNGDVIQKVNNASCDSLVSHCINSSSMSYTFKTQ